MKPIALVLVLALGGCAVTTNAEQPAPKGAAIKAMIVANKDHIWKDPDSVRGATITAPFQNGLLMTNSWLVCVRSNSRNGFGGYGGESDFIIALNEGRPEVLFEKADGACEQYRHEPFPELETKRQI